MFLSTQSVPKERAVLFVARQESNNYDMCIYYDGSIYFVTTVVTTNSTFLITFKNKQLYKTSLLRGLFVLFKN